MRGITTFFLTTALATQANAQTYHGRLEPGPLPGGAAGLWIMLGLWLLIIGWIAVGCIQRREYLDTVKILAMGVFAPPAFYAFISLLAY